MIDNPFTMELPFAGPIPMSAIAAQKTLTAALQFSAHVAGKEWKQLYVPLRIDKGHWSRIMAGQANFPAEKLEEFMELVGNNIPVIWLAYRRKLGCYVLESEQQRQIREKDEAIRKKDEQIAVLLAAIQGKPLPA